jgi:hypothetical protein
MGWDDLLAFRDLPQLEAGVGDYVFRTTFPFFMLSATMARCYAKPRGFPEDAETVAMIDRAEAEGDGRLGPLIDRWFLDRPLCRARRAGRTWMAATLATEVAARPSGEPVRVASLASGAAAELFDLYRTDTAARVRATCVDLDPEALLTTARTAQQRGLSDRVMCLRGNAVPVAGESLALPPQQIIYALGLWEYLRDDQAVAFLDWAHDHLVDDGLLIVTNLQPANPDRLLMAHLLDWRVTHRSVDDVQRLVAQSRFRAQAPTLAIEVTESQLFVRCPKG